MSGGHLCEYNEQKRCPSRQASNACPRRLIIAEIYGTMKGIVPYNGAPSCSTPHSSISKEKSPVGRRCISKLTSPQLYESARGLTDSPPDCLLRTAVRRPVRLLTAAFPKKKAPNGAFFFGAADGSRTHLSSLGSLHSTDELQPHCFADSMIS